MHRAFLQQQQDRRAHIAAPTATTPAAAPTEGTRAEAGAELRSERAEFAAETVSAARVATELLATAGELAPPTATAVHVFVVSVFHDVPPQACSHIHTIDDISTMHLRQA
ncbi:hypothetical protein AWN90_26385 [Nocardia terpenica]|uniref:Uncharacterized protein n=1 Tax=Nocardia terpenica TaxID=455432 RepID=A0A164NCZ2_9NOCA|nr:hypothetical protein AWN90_26385 [Nocardia terpenica]